MYVKLLAVSWHPASAAMSRLLTSMCAFSLSHLVPPLAQHLRIWSTRLYSSDNSVVPVDQKCTESAAGYPQSTPCMCLDVMGEQSVRTTGSLLAKSLEGSLGNRKCGKVFFFFFLKHLCNNISSQEERLH